MREFAWRGPLGVVSVLGVMACDEPIPPTPAGAFNVQFTDNGIDCNINNHRQSLGAVQDTGKPELIANGASNAEVDCTVKKAGSGYTISADLSGSATVVVELSGLSDAAIDLATAVDGQIQYVSPETGGEPYSSPSDAQCKFWVDTAKGQYLKAGEAWFSFSCPKVQNGNQICGLNESYVALKNCEGVPVEE